MLSENGNKPISEPLNTSLPDPDFRLNKEFNEKDKIQVLHEETKKVAEQKEEKGQTTVEESKTISSSITNIRNYIELALHSNLYPVSLNFLLHIENVAPKLITWCSYMTNKINIVEYETQQSYANLDGVRTHNIGKIQIFESSSI